MASWLDGIDINSLSTYERLQHAIYHRIKDRGSFRKLAKLFSVDRCKLHRVFQQWAVEETGREPEGPEDVHLVIRQRGRPTVLEETEERTICEAAQHYVKICLPLTRNDLIDLVSLVIENLPARRKQHVKFVNGHPSLQWVKSFISRHRALEVKSMRAIEDKRTRAVTKDIVGEHIARVRAAMSRFGIKDPRYVFNLDESGVSFRSMAGRSARKGIGSRDKKLVTTVAGTRGNLDRVTMMFVVNAAGKAYKPVVVYPGKQPHFRRVNGQIQTVMDCLPDSYFFQREPAGVDSGIFLSWAKSFLQETADLRRGGQNLLLVMDGYACHIQVEVLSLLRENNVRLIGLPAHTSHVLQPLDVSVFSSFKSHLQREFHRIARAKKVMDAFDVAFVLSAGYSLACSFSNIRSGFIRTGLWDYTKGSSVFEPLKDLPFFVEQDKPLLSLESVVRSFDNRSRALLQAVDVDEEGTIQVSTTNGQHLTSFAVLDALRSRDLNRKAAVIARQNREKERQRRMDYPESSSEMKALLALRPRRTILRKRLTETRRNRRLTALRRNAHRRGLGLV